MVVPIYNVELYLDECLESLAAQTFADFEAVLVDDGSTDASAEIAEAFTRRDPRFRLVRQENMGLGPARNTGAAAIDPDGEFLTFVDSDDIVPPNAYQLMIETLDQTGSDFVAGNVLRFRSVGFNQSWVHKAPFGKTRLRTHISAFPPLVTDRTAWNKVYRRSFWDEHSMRYPGILYEDAPVSIPLHFLAKSVDVLSEPVYFWRMREVGTKSITQNRTDPKGLVDRVTSIRMVRHFLRDRSGAEFRTFQSFYDENSLTEEMPIFFKVLPLAGPEYRDAFLDHVGAMIEDIGGSVMNALPETLRLKYWLTAKRRMDDLLALQAFDEEFPRAVPTRGTVRPRADYPFLRTSPPVDDTVLALHRAVGLQANVDVVRRQDDGQLQLQGNAYLKNLGAEHRYDSVRALMLRETGSRRTLVLPTRTVRRRDVTAGTPELVFRHADWSGFSVSFDPARLKRRGQWQDGTWRVTLGLFGKGRPRRTRLKAGLTGSGQVPTPFWVSDDVRVVPEIRDSHLYLRVETARARVGAARQIDDRIELRGSIAQRGGLDGALLRVRHNEDGSGRELRYPLELGTPGGGQVPFTAAFDPADLEEVRLDEAQLRPTALERESDHWSAELLLADGTELPLVMDGGEDSSSSAQFPFSRTDGDGTGGDGTDGDGAVGDARALLFKPSPSGYLEICDQPVQPRVERVSAVPEQQGFLLEGTFPLPGRHTFDLVLRHKIHTRRAPVTPGESVDGRFSVVLPAVPNDSFGGDLPLQAGEWELRVRLDRGEAVEEFKLHIAPNAMDALPLAVEARGKQVTFSRRWYDCLLLTADSALADNEAGNYHQYRLRTEFYPAARTRPLRQAVLFDSFDGGGYADSPRAVHEELVRRGSELEQLWVVDDLQAELPPTLTAVRRHSPEWYEALARSRYLVGNTTLPPWVERREGQIILQTWHGTPVKKIGFDFENDWYTDPDQLRDLEQGARQWSLLLSPNPASTPVLRRALRFEGEVLETGLPRTDRLYAEDREQRAAQVRHRLGLPEGKQVVLYAPTWREDQQGFYHGLGLDLRIDLAAAKAALGADQVLLVRPHQQVTEVAPGSGDGYLWDVADYPDVEELMLVADVLVTDYSSVLPDFVGTGKPVLLFGYDLEHYRDALRGFSFDYEAEAPGPLLRTSEELVEALRDVAAATAPYAEAYAAFQKTYSPWDDGRAAVRVVDALLNK
ncbi:CDP-glycerol glycerophosphotransferase family protein [Streptacidiphilus sp. EB129]|uniref:bifunctional glycosyltransferase/CDP-glycerol:glycerophosphate glycerophosphotransferase n=1 Tax=Streptacidiphilus sp. EB129 TaxID=3156262 RepID=UPI003515FA96